MSSPECAVLSGFRSTPAILGGDFNAGATDVVHRQLTRDFGHIYSSRQLQPVCTGVIVSKKTDHRIVIADLRVRQ